METKARLSVLVDSNLLKVLHSASETLRFQTQPAALGLQLGNGVFLLAGLTMQLVLGRKRRAKLVLQGGHVRLLLEKKKEREA